MKRLILAALAAAVLSLPLCIDPMGVSEYYVSNESGGDVHVSFTAWNKETKTVTVNPKSTVLILAHSAIPRNPRYDKSFQAFSITGAAGKALPVGVKSWEKATETCQEVPGGVKCRYTLAVTAD